MYWPQKQSQSGNIDSIILDVYVGRQSAQNFPSDAAVTVTVVSAATPLACRLVGFRNKGSVEFLLAVLDCSVSLR